VEGSRILISPAIPNAHLDASRVEEHSHGVGADRDPARIAGDIFGEKASSRVGALLAKKSLCLSVWYVEIVM